VQSQGRARERKLNTLAIKLDALGGGFRLVPIGAARGLR
jgi:hypothetical protein